MDRCAVSGAAEVPDVSPGLDVRASETIKNHTASNENTNEGGAHDETTNQEGDSDEVGHGSSEPEDVVASAKPQKRKRNLSTPYEFTNLPEPSVPKRQRRNSEPANLASAGSNEEQRELAMLRTVPAKMRKYFAQRHRLFHRYDEGIQLDEEAWYSVTPEKIAAHIAGRFSHLKVVVDLYSCVGGNSIQFARAGMHVIAVEIDPQKIEMAKNNAAVYGVQDNIDFRKGDVFEVLSSLKDEFNSDWGIFLSPPWGGPAYVQQQVFDVSIFKEAISKAMDVSANVAILVPRNISNENVAQNFGSCEVEENYLGGKLKTKTLYFGELEGRTVAVDDMQPS